MGVGSVLGGAAFILSMGLSFSGDAPELGFDEEGIPLDRDGEPYPRELDAIRKLPVPFPKGSLEIVPESERAIWNNDTRKAFIREWQARGYPRPASNWEKEPEIHHIKPLSRGGTNDFDNLVPLSPKAHKRFTKYWSKF